MRRLPGPASGRLGKPRKLSAEALEVAKGEFIDDADEPVKFKKGVLKRRGCEKRFLVSEYGLLYRLADLVIWLIYIAESVRFIDDHEIPRSLADVRLFGPHELVRANYNAVALKGIQVPSRTLAYMLLYSWNRLTVKLFGPSPEGTRLRFSPGNSFDCEEASDADESAVVVSTGKKPGR